MRSEGHWERARDDVDIAREVLLEGFDLRVLTRGLAAYDGAEAGCLTGVGMARTLAIEVETAFSRQ